MFNFDTFKMFCQLFGWGKQCFQTRTQTNTTGPTQSEGITSASVWWFSSENIPCHSIILGLVLPCWGISSARWIPSRAFTPVTPIHYSERDLSRSHESPIYMHVYAYKHTTLNPNLSMDTNQLLKCVNDCSPEWDHIEDFNISKESSISISDGTKNN